MAKPKTPLLTPEDHAAFRAATRGVKPLQHTKKVSIIPERSSSFVRQPTEKVCRKSMDFEFSDHEHLPVVTSEEILQFSRTGVQHKMLRKLRQGQYNKDAILDLHGKNVVQARECLSQFLL